MKIDYGKSIHWVLGVGMTHLDGEWVVWVQILKWYVELSFVLAT